MKVMYPKPGQVSKPDPVPESQVKTQNQVRYLTASSQVPNSLWSSIHSNWSGT